MCRQCARGGCPFDFRNRGAPTNRALASACSPAPTTNYSQLGFRVHPPNPPQGRLSCSLLPLAALQKMCVSQQPELKWTLVGLWVLAACAGRSTRSKGSQQTLRFSHPVKVARKQGKQGDFLRGRARGRPNGICLLGGPREIGGVAPSNRPQKVPESASLGPQTPRRVPPGPR